MKKHFIPGTQATIYSLEKYFAFGVDSILLSAFSKGKKEDIHMDICSGTGIVALRNALLYCPKKMIAVEIQGCLTALLEKAVEENDLKEIMETYTCPFQDLKAKFSKKIGILTCNPPYVKQGEGMENDFDPMNLSRHEITMKLEDVFSFGKEVLKDKGRLYMIHRPYRLAECAYHGKKYGLAMKRLRMIHGKEKNPPKMILMEFVKGGKDYLHLEAPLMIYEKGAYSEAILQAYQGGGI